MEIFYFSEMPYPLVPDEVVEEHGSMRVTLPNRLFDREKGNELLHRYIEEYMYASEHGFNLMLNEHHQTATCLNAATNVVSSYLAANTTKGKILLLGNQLAHQNPIKMAEELAMLDHLSKGRLISGFVRGVGSEVHPSNTPPSELYERFYEAHDLIKKAWSTGEPFNWEGDFHHYRYVNLWPRPYQDPMPEIWTTGIFNADHIKWAARNRYTFGITLTNLELTNRAYKIYRDTCEEEGIPFSPEKLSYSTLMYTAETDEQAEEEGKQLLWYLEDLVPQELYTPAGYNKPEAMIRLANQAGLGERGNHDWEDFKKQGSIMVGSPETMVENIKRHYEQTGGYGNLIMMAQAGHMNHEQVKRSIKLFAEEVYPKIKHLGVSVKS